MSACFCESGRQYEACCGRLHFGAENASTPEALMRSRYSAYVQGLEAYLLATWHADTRPPALDLSVDQCKWLGLAVRQSRLLDATHATVEFVACYRCAGRGHRLHEISNFVFEGGRWYYVDGLVQG